MAVEYFKASEDIHGRMRELVSKNHGSLIVAVREILIMFRSTAQKRGGEPVMGTASKVTAREKGMAQEDYEFVLILAEDVWKELTHRQQEALLDHLLSHCRVKENPKTGKDTFTIVPPDLLFFKGNVKRYGFWFPSVQESGGMRFQVINEDEEEESEAA